MFDPAVLPVEALLTEFFVLHDASIDRAGGSGGQYRSAIFYKASDPQAERLRQASQEMLRRLLHGGYQVTTEVAAIEAFHPASARHQQYCSSRGITPKRRGDATIRRILTGGER